jgi:hypothetical protein
MTIVTFNLQFKVVDETLLRRAYGVLTHGHGDPEASLAAMAEQVVVGKDRLEEYFGRSFASLGLERISLPDLLRADRHTFEL